MEGYLSLNLVALACASLRRRAFLVGCSRGCCCGSRSCWGRRSVARRTSFRAAVRLEGEVRLSIRLLSIRAIGYGRAAERTVATFYRSAVGLALILWARVELSGLLSLYDASKCLVALPEVAFAGGVGPMFY